MAVLRSWPVHLELDEHLRAAYGVELGASLDDAEAVLAVVRLTRHEPGLRAVWLVLHERAEPIIAGALAARLDRPVDDLDVRLRAAAVNATLRVLTDDLAWTVAGGPVTTAALGHHRDRLAGTLRTLTRLPDGCASALLDDAGGDLVGRRAGVAGALEDQGVRGVDPAAVAGHQHLGRTC